MYKWQWIPKILMLFFIAGCQSRPAQDNENSKSADTNVRQADKLQTEKVILFFGNSLTAGYGLELTEAYPHLIQQRLDSLGYNYKVINAGVSGETTAAGSSRIDWVLRQKIDVFVLELGGNDGLRGIPVAETRKNLQSIIDKVRKKYPDVKIILAGMQVPPSMGKKYADEFKNVYPELSAHNKVGLVPFLLEGVGGERALNLKDGIHPTAEGHRIVAENVWNILKTYL